MGKRDFALMEGAANIFVGLQTLDNGKSRADPGGFEPPFEAFPGPKRSPGGPSDIQATLRVPAI